MKIYLSMVCLLLILTLNQVAADDKLSTTSPMSDSALGSSLSVYQEELYQTRKTEEAERKSVLIRRESERTQAQIENEISIRKSKIEDLKMREQKIQSEIVSMKADVVDLQKKYSEIEAQSEVAFQKQNDFLNALEREKKSMEEARSRYDELLVKLNQRHEKVVKATTSNLIQIQSYKAELSTLEGQVDQVQDQVLRLQNDEMKSSTEVAVLKTAIKEKKNEEVSIIATLKEAEKKYLAAQRIFKQAQMDLVSAEKSLKETSSVVSNDIKRLDDSAFTMQKNRAIAEANRLRVEAEIEKLKNYLVMVRKSNADLSLADQKSEVDLMNSQLALEVVRSELGQQLAYGDKLRPVSADRSLFTIRNVNLKAQRSIASTQEQEEKIPLNESKELPQKLKQWTVTKTCAIRTKARSASSAMGEVAPGSSILASRGPGDWVTTEVDGKTVYIRKECGTF